ncbi:MAG: FAD-dependent oxidoreductase [Tannerella sp.]|jgi:protoporphyrinogen oxidase|nr:FAD-dependent oxidoreductase [Tannerella sp.]
MDEKIYDCIVVGGGISGISFAYYLKNADKTVLLIDNKEHPGGQIETGQYGKDPGFRFEMGAHTCYNSYTNLISIINESGFRENVQPLLKYGYVVYAKNKIGSIFSQLSVLRMIPKFLNYFSATKAGKTVKEYFLPIVGEKNYNRLFRYAFRAVICQPADDYPAEIFLKKRDTRNKTYPRKFTFKKGLSSLMNYLLERYEIENLFSTDVIDVRRENEIYTITTHNGIQFQAKNICLAAGHQTASLLLRYLEKEISGILSDIHTYQIDSMNIMMENKSSKLKKVAGIISLSDSFLSAVSRDLVENGKYRSFTFHYESKKYGTNEKREISDAVLGISPADVCDAKFSTHSLPLRRMEDIDVENKIDNLLNNKSIYITGNYFKGLAMEDCVMRSKSEAGRFLRSNL